MLSKYVFFIITFIVGIIFKHYYDQVKNKVQKINYSVYKTFLGATANDSLLGKVEILYNNKPVGNLYLCEIKLVNISNKDFENIKITVWCDVESVIFSAHSAKESTINTLKLTEEYVEECRKYNLDGIDNVPNHIKTRLPYIIPILNRDENVNFTCLVSNEKGEEPYVHLNCERAGLKLEENIKNPRIFWGENERHSAIYGIIICATLMIPTLYFIDSKIFASIIIFILGIFCIAPGAIFLKLLNKIKQAIR
ncbi:hypothetical protein HOH15_07685 [Candidatus Woesearchaeota archaeon]|jgi:hypothetical protein|nr:hypothetical protein [Candidatus Woesearchaeota archaeon]